MALSVGDLGGVSHDRFCHDAVTVRLPVLLLFKVRLRTVGTRGDVKRSEGEGARVAANCRLAVPGDEISVAPLFPPRGG